MYVTKTTVIKYSQITIGYDVHQDFQRKYMIKLLKRDCLIWIDVYKLQSCIEKFLTRLSS
jgi:hypothetical protein